MRKVFIDESTGNPFPISITLVDSVLVGFSPYSTDGFSHKDELIKSTAKKLAEIVNLKKGQKTIDVGYGSNLSVAEAMQELGMESYGLDSQDGLDKKRFRSPLFVPPYFNTEHNRVKKYCGTIEDIFHTESELRNKKFDLIIFWGSWESGGYNFAIGGEMGEFRVREENSGKDFSYPSEELNDLIQKNKEKVLKDTSNLLNPNGGIMVVSSRYASHGAGFTTDQLPWEKRIMLRLAQTFSDLKAKEVYLIGLSKTEVQKQLGKSPNFATIAKELNDDSVLFEMDREVYESNCPRKTLQSIKNMQVSLGRIDVIYGRF